MTAQTSAPQVENIRPLRENEVAALREMADRGPAIFCDCNGSSDLCTCSTIIMLCDEWATLRKNSPDSEGVEARPKIVSDLQELMDVIEAVRGQRGLLRVSGARSEPGDVGVLGIERFNDLMMRAIEALSIRPQASAGERGITDTMVLTGAKAIYIERSGAAEHLRINEKTCDEHFDWYEVGKSNPDSCVHYSNIAFALRDARACLSATLEPGRGK